MVTTPNSLKYLKFAGGLTEKNIRKWIESVDNTFGLVKWDKGTRFFHGDMVQSGCQLLNTLGPDKAQVEELLKPSFDYISLVRNDVEFMRYHFMLVVTRELKEICDWKLEMMARFIFAGLWGSKKDILITYRLYIKSAYLKNIEKRRK